MQDFPQFRAVMERAAETRSKFSSNVFKVAKKERRGSTVSNAGSDGRIKAPNIARDALTQAFESQSSTKTLFGKLGKGFKRVSTKKILNESVHRNSVYDIVSQAATQLTEGVNKKSK